MVADGANSGLRQALGVAVTEKTYGQSAVICNVTPEVPHGGRAFERFTPSGPLAMLPLLLPGLGIGTLLETALAADRTYALDDPDHPINRWRTERAPLEDIASFVLCPPG